MPMDFARVRSDQYPWNTKPFGLPWIFVELVLTTIELVEEIDVPDIEFVGSDSDDGSW